VNAPGRASLGGRSFPQLNDIRTTAEVAPHWRMVSERSGQPIDERLMEDITDPHFSTWPACRAVKAVFLQGDDVGERYLRRMRRAALTERKVISLPEAYAYHLTSADACSSRSSTGSGAVRATPTGIASVIPRSRKASPTAAIASSMASE